MCWINKFRHESWLFINQKQQYIYSKRKFYDDSTVQTFDSVPMASRFIKMTSGGILLGIVGAFIGGKLGASMANNSNGSELGDWQEFIYGVSIGYTIGNSFGVYQFGKMSGGRGRYLGALAGSALGMVGAISIINQTGSIDGKAQIGISIVLPTALSIIGFELITKEFISKKT